MNDDLHISVVYTPHSAVEAAVKLCKLTEPVHREFQPNWPTDLCLVTNLMLAPMIRFYTICTVSIAIGLFNESVFHAWLMTPEGYIIDPTHGQFDGGDNVRVILANNQAHHGYRADLTLSADQEEMLRRTSLVHPVGGTYFPDTNLLEGILRDYPCFQAFQEGR